MNKLNEIIIVAGLEYHITITSKHVQIGCMLKTKTAWRKVSYIYRDIHKEISLEDFDKIRRVVLALIQ